MRDTSSSQSRLARIGLILAASGAWTDTLAAQLPDDLDGLSDHALYDAACANCHGADGRGLEQALLGFEEEVPDFTDCDFAAREPDADWIAVAHEGGPVRGFSAMMPAFRGAPHHTEIVLPEQVQIYEAVMVDGTELVTTGLMSAERLVKDNRLLPSGFDTGRADPRVAVHGEADSDSDFAPGADRISYAIDIETGAGPFTVSAELWFQPVGFRWAENLSSYDAFETNRFVRYYREMAAGSAMVLTTDVALAR